MNVMLPVAVSLTVLGLILAIILWLRGRRGRAVQALGFSVLPMGLYLTGLLVLVFDAVTALARWGVRLVFSPIIGIGLSLIGLAIVLWIVGGFVARRTRPAVTTGADRAAAASGRDTRNKGAGKALQPKAPKAQASGAGDEFDEIEELLRNRGIQ
ncbi:MAG: hypothetical protein Q4G46_10000 [Propionibacteriaceae bacterium]|nr:hypothetical protein [Propionibacteriaceae bacterium]